VATSCGYDERATRWPVETSLDAASSTTRDRIGRDRPRTRSSLAPMTRPVREGREDRKRSSPQEPCTTAKPVGRRSPGVDYPVPSSPAVSAKFRRQARRDTAPERALRRHLHRNGLRYRVDIAPLASLRRRADVVFTRQRVAVFVDGCFWHGCVVHRSWPKTNAQWWKDKIEANQRRDRETDDRLVRSGWTVVRVWEHDAPERAAGFVTATVVGQPHPAVYRLDENAWGGETGQDDGVTVRE
jgi:DNA mismatch endonuclease (patch repair protein)